MLTVRTIARARTRIVLAAAAVTLSLLAACGDGTEPNPPVDRVVISGVSVDPTTFRSNGTFAMGIVATDAGGKVILDGGADIDAGLTTPAAGSTIDVVSRSAQRAGSKPIAAALDIDNSGSMSGSDPALMRRAAARGFWEAVLGARSANEVALADFGHGQTPGFGSTRLLQSWGKDPALLTQRLDSMTASGGTPLYESALEMLRWTDTTRAAGSFERVMLLMTDGQPDSDARRDSAATLATVLGIKIHTVGLGAASDLDPRLSNAAAVLRVRELAYRTGGVYAAASSAAALDTIFRTIATASSAGQFLASFRISPIPPSGTVVNGTVTVTSGGATREAIWSMVAP